jgi:4-hydroxy-tetrahydrodipicolinate synthase
MVRAHDAKAWAKEELRGICDSLYTPFSGRDGDEVDYDAVRDLVRYTLGDLDHDGLWLVSGLAEFWSLTMDERKQIAEVTIDEARSVKPGAILQLCTVAASAKETVELTLHAQDLGADICYIQNPFIEAHGGRGVLEFFEYVAARTDIALGMFNSPCSGFVLSSAECAQISEAVPAVCAIKDAADPQPYHGIALAKMAPDLVVWEAEIMLSYNSGLVQQGLQSPCMLGGVAYLGETPSDKRVTTWFNLVLEGKLTEASEYYFAAGVDTAGSHGLGYTMVPERLGYYTHWGSAFKYCASLLGLPVGDYPYSRTPQIKLSDQQQARIKDAYLRSGLIDA